MKQVTILMICGLFFSCGESNVGKSSAPSQQGDVQQFGDQEGGSATLAGATVTSDCHFEDSTGYHVQFVDNYTLTEFSWETRYYMDANCTQQSISEVIEGSYSLGGEVSDGVFELDYQIEAYGMTFLIEEQVTQINDNSYCGMNDWGAGVRKELQGTKCGFPDTMLGMRYSSVAIDGSEIHYTGPDDGDSAGERNTSIDWDVTYQSNVGSL